MLKPVMMSDKVLYMKYNGLLKPVMFYKEDGGQYIDTIYDTQGNPVNPRTLVNVSDGQFEFAYEHNKGISGNLRFDELVSVGESAFYLSFYESDMIESVEFPKLEIIDSFGPFTGSFQRYCTGLTSARFPLLKEILGDYSCNAMFISCSNLTEVDLSNLETVDGYDSCASMFAFCSSLQDVKLPKLKSLIGDYCFYNIFSGCNIKNISFDSLDDISGYFCLRSAISGCPDLENVYFPALKTTSFGTNKNQFGYIVASSGTQENPVVIHFPSNLEETIQTLDGYPLFGGDIGCVTLAFDLPTTE